MPLYEYECTACHKRTEKIQKFSDPEITACPKCRGVLERVISAPAISFKGGGWYADGYGNAKPAASSSGPSEGSGAGSGNSESGSKESGSKPSSGKESKPSTESVSSASTPPAAASSASAAPAASSNKS